MTDQGTISSEGPSENISAPGNRSPQVFVSYTHDSRHHKGQVLRFSTFLLSQGIDAHLDQWFTERRRDWYAWAIKHMTEADFVIVVASPGYRGAGDGNIPSYQNRGIQSEASLLRDLLHNDRETWLPKLLPVILPGHTVDDIPLFLQPYTADHYWITEFTTEGAEDLLRVITAQPGYPRPPLGPTPVLPPHSTASAAPEETEETENGSAASSAPRAMTAAGTGSVRQSGGGQNSANASLVGYAMALAVSVILAGVGIFVYQQGVADKLVSVISMFTGLIGLPLTARGLLATLRPPPNPRWGDMLAELDRASRVLAEAVRVQWEREVVMRSLRRPAPLQVRWSTTRLPVAARAEAILGEAVGGRPVRLRLHGRLDEIVDKYLQLPKRQLVVLGEPGAGKTVLALLLTLGLLDRREPDGSVPVLLNISSWNPTTEHLHTWISRRLSEDYPILNNLTVYGRRTAERLVITQRVLPILDGLDEIPQKLRATAIAEIDRASDSRPLVVTCRSAEFETVVRTGGTLMAAAVVELEPVSVKDTLTYLRRGTVAGDDRWTQVEAHLQQHPDSALATALSTPLMVSLAHAIYGVPSANPGELLDLTRFANPAAIQAHLLDAFVTTAYANNPPPPALQFSPQPVTGPWTPQQTRRWLTFLASYLQRRQTRDLAWWKFHEAVPWKTTRCAFGVAVGLVSALTGMAVIGLAVGLFAGLTDGLTAATVGGLATGFVFGSGFWLAAPFMSVPDAPGRLYIQLERWEVAKERRVGVISGSLVLAAVGGLVAGLAVDWVVGLAGGLSAALTGGIFGGFVQMAAYTNAAEAVNPLSMLRSERRATIALGLIIGLALGPPIGFIFGLKFGPLAGLIVALTSGFSVGFGFMMGKSWIWFQGVRTWLAIRGQLPWRLMAFLDNAHRRGVLRQSGGVYQFRHALLQECLALRK